VLRGWRSIRAAGKLWTAKVVNFLYPARKRLPKKL